MANETQGYGVVDPLADYWGLSLFPQASGVQPPQPSKPYDPDDDLHSIDNHLRSMALRSPSKFMEQAKSIVDSNPGLFNSENLANAASNETNDVVNDEAKKNHRERRPGLGLQRARFSLKPNKNHTIENLIPTLDIDTLKDPEEFFKAHERLENATKEIQKQMGGVLHDENQKNASTRIRQRRPGLLGNNQRSVRYKHLYPLKSFENNENVPSSQETFESESCGPDGESLEKTGTHIDIVEDKLADSSAAEEDKMNDILDKLLHGNCDDLEGDGAVTRLQETLQIKPLVLEKLSIPDFPDNQVTDLKSFGGKLSKPRKALSNIDNLLKNMSEKTPVTLRKDLGSPVQQLASPTPPRNPFAPLSSLQKRISQLKPSVDPFSAVDISDLSTRNPPLTDVENQELNLADPDKSFTGQNASQVEDMIDIGMGGLVEDTVRNCASTYVNSKQDNSRETDLCENIDSNRFPVDMEVNIGRNDMDDRIMDDTVNRPVSEANETCELEDKEENVQEVTASAPTGDQEPNLHDPLDQPSPAGFVANGMGECTQTDDGLEKHKEVTSFSEVQEKTGGSQLSGNEKRKGKLRRNKRKEKEYCRRQSLAAAGTSWLNGVRRSCRMRTRPLEYWKGERPVYGRIHESLPTVIGLKYMSPGTADGKPNLKVKSYVSDKYKDLLELASLH